MADTGKTTEGGGEEKGGEKWIWSNFDGIPKIESAAPDLPPEGYSDVSDVILTFDQKSTFRPVSYPPVPYRTVPYRLMFVAFAL